MSKILHSFFWDSIYWVMNLVTGWSRLHMGKPLVEETKNIFRTILCCNKDLFLLHNLPLFLNTIQSKKWNESTIIFLRRTNLINRTNEETRRRNRRVWKLDVVINKSSHPRFPSKSNGILEKSQQHQHHTTEIQKKQHHLYPSHNFFIHAPIVSKAKQSKNNDNDNDNIQPSRRQNRI